MSSVAPKKVTWFSRGIVVFCIVIVGYSLSGVARLRVKKIAVVLLG